MHAVEFDIYRHAQATINTMPGVVIGRSSDAPLDDAGEEQAALLGEFQAHEVLYPDIAFSSPIKRARDTGTVALRVSGEMLCLDPNFPVIQDERLQEQSLGTNEGQLSKDVYTPKVREQIDRVGANYQHPGGQSMAEVGNEMMSWITDTARTAEREGMRRVQAYSHNTAIATLLARIAGIERPIKMRDHVLSTLRSKQIGNASRTLLVYEGGRIWTEHIGQPTQ